MSDIIKSKKLKNWVHYYAPTATFKCCVDGAGKDTKQYYRKAEQAQSVRCDSVRKLYTFLKEKMPPPRKDQKRLMSFDSRHHVYLVDKSEQEIGDENDDSIIVTDFNLYWDSHPVRGIESCYALLVDKDTMAKDTNTHYAIKMRNHSCSCDECLKKPGSNCCKCSEIIGQWKLKSIRKKEFQPAQNAPDILRFYEQKISSVPLIPNTDIPYPVFIAIASVYDTNHGVTDIDLGILIDYPKFNKKEKTVSIGKIGDEGNEVNNTGNDAEIVYTMSARCYYIEYKKLLKDGENTYTLTSAQSPTILPLDNILKPSPSAQNKYTYIKCEGAITSSGDTTYTINMESLNKLIEENLVG